MMKVALISFLFLLASCSTTQKDLEFAISFGEIKELNQYSLGVEKQLYVRLFQSPVYKEGCFKETHGVCQYRYFLSVSTFDEHPETNIFPLNEQGEITAIEWQDSNEIDAATIDFIMEKYTKSALLNNPELVSKAMLMRVALTPKIKEETLTKKLK